MRVDRSRFLLLASAMAACGPRRTTEVPMQTASDPDTGPSAVGTVASPPAKGADGVVGAPWSGGTAKEGGAPTFEGGGWTPPSNAEGYPAPMSEGYPPPNAEGSGSLKGMGIPVSSWTCSGSDDVGKAPYCAIKVPKSCAPFPFVHQSCNGARKYFKPKIAERAVTCSNKLTPNAVCSAMTYDCRDAAMRSACPDPQADFECQAIAKKCPKMSMTECRMYMNGLNAVGRAEVIKCMSGGPGCGYGVYSCTEGLND